MVSADEARVLDRIQERHEDLVELLVRLIRFRTVAPLLGERAEGSDYRDLQAFVSERLRRLGFAVETGALFENVSTGSFVLKTLGVSFLDAGIHFYF